MQPRLKSMEIQGYRPFGDFSVIPMMLSHHLHDAVQIVAIFIIDNLS